MKSTQLQPITDAYSHGSTKLEWLKSLQVGDKVDVLRQSRWHDDIWVIGTIKEIIPYFQFTIKIDGSDIRTYSRIQHIGWYDLDTPSGFVMNKLFKDSGSESSSEDDKEPEDKEPEHVTQFKQGDFPHRILRRLYEMAPRHDHIICKDGRYSHDSGRECSVINSYHGGTDRCWVCNNLCCMDCYLMVGSNCFYCRDCWFEGWYKYIYYMTQLLYEILFRAQNNESEKYIERNILTMITNFGLFFLCPTHGEFVSFDAQFERGIIGPGIVENKVDIDHLKKEEFWDDGMIGMDCNRIHFNLSRPTKTDYNFISSNLYQESSVPTPNLFDDTDDDEEEWSCVS